MDSVQMLDNLNVGAELEDWPLHRDLTLSPPLKSQPIAVEQEGEHLTLKSNSVSNYNLQITHSFVDVAPRVFHERFMLCAEHKL